MGKRSREKRSRHTTSPSRPVTSTSPHKTPAAPPPPPLPYDGPLPPRETERGAWPTDRTAVGVLFGIALLVRAILLIQIARTPYFQVGNIDSVAYQQWAARLVAGEWLPRGTFYQSPLYA